MGSNIRPGTNEVGLYKWRSDARFREQVKVIKKRGRRMANEFIENPRTPFEALRILLNISREEWARKCDASNGTIGSIERGDAVANPALAKRMVDEARSLGVACTMDELFQHVVPWGKEVQEN